MSKEILNISQIQNAYDKGGEFNVAMTNKKYVYNNVTYTYIASGHMRDVFVSDCGRWVVKLPSTKNTFFEYFAPTDTLSLNPPLLHNLHEYNCYVGAPEIFKKHIAKCELLPNGVLLQEFVTVKYIGGFYREIGYRANGDCVIFDCDCFLHNFEKPPRGYEYILTFGMLIDLFPKEIADYIDTQK